MEITATPSPLYGDGARTLQDTFDSRRLADRLTDYTLRPELHDDAMDLIRDQSEVWIATVDAEGWPDVSYKGGAAGFVDVISPSELRIPSYDGNGMFRTLGNVVDTGRVAMLFRCRTRNRRLRVHGSARVSTDPADVGAYVGAQAVLIVTVHRMFPNCGRYLHTHDELSIDVPAEGHEPPTPEWKTYPFFAEVLPKA